MPQFLFQGEDAQKAMNLAERSHERSE